MVKRGLCGLFQGDSLHGRLDLHTPPTGGKLTFSLAPPANHPYPSQLETDPTILIPKARQAIERYGHQIVVGNLLATRKSEVVFVTKESEMWLRVPYVPISQDPSSMHHHEIEEDITEHLTELHDAWTKGKPLPIPS